MQALITGGAGFIGSNIARALTAQGWGIRILDDLSSGYRGNLDGLAVDFRHGDVRDPAAVADAVAGCDVVFHLAASVGNKRSIDDPVGDASVNVIGRSYPTQVVTETSLFASPGSAARVAL